MTCTNCNATIPEGSTLCPKCQSTPLTNTMPQKAPLWKRSKVFLGLIGVLGLWMVSGIVGQFSSSKGDEIALLDVAPGNEANEERFLLCLLESNIDRILVSSHQKPEVAAVAVAETREYAEAIVAHLQQHPVQTKGFLEAFQKVVALADAYDGLVREVDGIETAAKEKRGTEAIKAGLKGGALGWSAMQSFDSGDGTGAIVGIAGALFSSWQHGKALEADKRAQIERVASAFFAQLDQARADAVLIADRVAERNAWSRASIGFARDRKSYGQEQLLHRSEELAAVLADLTRQRPLDPILQFKSIMLQDDLDGDGTTQQKYLEWAAKFVELARLVPSGAVYDFFRWRYMMRAGTAALKAAEQEAKGKKLGESAKAAGTAVSCWKTAMSINQSDASGELRWGYGQSLAMAGYLDEAREILPTIRDHVCLNPDYHYLLARLYAVNDEAEKALAHLKEAVENGLTKVAEARVSADLANLRNAYGDQVASLLAVKFGWAVKYGVFNDDITLTNQSPFPLTHVVLRPVISNSKGSFTPKQQLTLENLGPGQSHTWVNCISVTAGGDNDTRKAELQCDQGTR